MPSALDLGSLANAGLRAVLETENMPAPHETPGALSGQCMIADSPEVSVIVVAYNAGRFLAPALASVLAQDGVSLELILVDNGSTDGSVTGWLATNADARVRSVALAINRFHAGGLNVAFPCCRAPFIALMDADDVSLPGRLASQVNALRQDPSLAVVGCLAETMDEHDRVIAPSFSILDEKEARAYLEFDVPFLPGTAMVRRPVGADLGWREELRWAHDFDFLARAAEVGRLGCLPQVLYRYRVHPASITSRHGYLQAGSASFVRLAAARRRAGRDEGYETLAQEHHAWTSRERGETETYAHFARRFAAEGFSALALMHARRAMDRCHGFSMAALAITVLIRSTWKEPARWWFLLRLALLGPAHALNVQCVPPLASRWPRLLQPMRRRPPAPRKDQVRT